MHEYAVAWREAASDPISISAMKLRDDWFDNIPPAVKKQLSKPMFQVAR